MDFGILFLILLIILILVVVAGVKIVSQSKAYVIERLGEHIFPKTFHHQYLSGHRLF